MNVALLILFNHKYERNLPKLRQIYKHRFSHVYFIMPFYNGNEEDVVCVYGNSFYFQGYISQALQRIKNESFDHYMVIGDDLILHPEINQDNYARFFKLVEGSGFIPEVFLLHDRKSPRKLMRKEEKWYWNNSAVEFEPKQKGIEVEKELPDVHDAKNRLLKHGYHFHPLLDVDQLTVQFPPFDYLKDMSLKTYVKHVYNSARKNLKLKNEQLRTIKYPMVGSYSDIVIVPKSSVDLFAHYAGITAALGLFVEIAVPTALLLTTDDVRQEKDLDNCGMTLWELEEFNNIEKAYNNSLSLLFENFPEKTLYIHPIKLSKWNL